MHENCKASKTGQEKETKDAPSIVNVNWQQGLNFGLFPFHFAPFSWNIEVWASLVHVHRYGCYLIIRL
ncbi:hypothetical protein TanjilG_29406 [Lupinus angustifolius]|uniref:Uncharacterized protein n=1 Tax=Lupinus angustifolius TaxID=3871 RepID=A0A1J7GF23_LUPAN|nr:hypothetical protein TanjilG_29406 [Lupinus angustifolius]